MENPWFQHQIATVIKFIGRELVKWMRMLKAKIAAILILKSNKLYVLLYISTYTLWVDILWSVKNKFCF